jgi:hypothetical protein
MTSISKQLSTLLLLGLVPVPVNAAPRNLPYCNNVVRVTTDVSETVYVRKLVLNGHDLRVSVERAVVTGRLKRHPTATIDESFGIGYQLDGSAFSSVQPLVRTSDLTTILLFSRLKNGNHQLRIGLYGPDGEVSQDNTYCFTSPDKFTLTGP